MLTSTRLRCNTARACVAQNDGTDLGRRREEMEGGGHRKGNTAVVVSKKEWPRSWLDDIIERSVNSSKECMYSSSEEESVGQHKIAYIAERDKEDSSNDDADNNEDHNGDGEYSNDINSDSLVNTERLWLSLCQRRSV